MRRNTQKKARNLEPPSTLVNFMLDVKVNAIYEEILEATRDGRIEGELRRGASGGSGNATKSGLLRYLLQEGLKRVAASQPEVATIDGVSGLL